MLSAGGFDLLVGPRFARRLALTHAVDDFADAFINLSLVGSLFFSVSLDASRSRILLYLLLTAAPLVLAAPLVGPALDRSHVAYRAAIVGSQLVRALAAVALIGALYSLALYPIAFVVLMCRRIYGLAKTALLTRMTGDRDEFLRADSHITRTGAAVGGLGVVAGGVLLVRQSMTVMLLLASLLLLIAALDLHGSIETESAGAAVHLATAASRRHPRAGVVGDSGGHGHPRCRWGADLLAGVRHQTWR